MAKSPMLFRTQTPAQALKAAIDSFEARCVARNLSPNTVRFYRHRFTAFWKFLEDRQELAAPEDLTPAQLRAFLAQQTKDISDLTAHHGYVTLRAFFHYLVREELITKNPMDKVEPVRQKKKVITTFTPEDVVGMLATCGADFVGLRDRAILLILVDCGLRVSELCGLRIDSINWKERTFLVLGKGNKEREVPFGQQVQRALSIYLARRGELPGVPQCIVSCYGMPISRQRLLLMIHARGEQAGIHGVMLSPHNFRRYFAVQFLKNGGDVFSLQKLLGHTSLEMSRRYAELAQADLVEKHRVCSPGDALQALTAQITRTGRTRMK